MRRRSALAAVLLGVGAILGTGSVAGEVSALAPSDVVLAFDFSNSILRSPTKANLAFAKALDKIADRVADTSEDLVKGNAKISFEVFGGKALAYPGCTDIALHDQPAAVGVLEECLRKIAREYRAGKNAPIAGRVDSADTDHVAALEKAATMLPADSPRPAVIFFTDGENDPAGKSRDKEDVAARIQSAYEGFNPLAILPVGLGTEASRFETELNDIHIQNFRGMDPCDGRERFEWPGVVFPSPGTAGDKVAVALQEVTCSFTVAPTPTPTPTPTPVPTPAPSAPGPPQDVAAKPTNNGLLLTWQAPSNTGTGQVTGNLVRCRRIDTDAWGSPTTAGPTVNETQVNDLDPGYLYECQVAAINAVGQGAWSAASAATAPLGLPPAPGKPATEPGDAQVAVSVPDPGALGVLVKSYIFECADGQGDAPVGQPAPGPSATITGLTNGTEYTCKAYAENDLGRSQASPASDLFTPCSSLWNCYPSSPWIALFIFVLLALTLLWLAGRWLRPKRWLTAMLDDGDTTGLGWGPRVGARIDQDGTAYVMRGDRRPSAPIRIHDRRGDHMEVATPDGISKMRPGQSIAITDDGGGIHNLILRRYSKPPKPASPPEDDGWSSTSRTSANTAPSTDEEVWS